MEETGVMFCEKPDADAPWRSEQEVSDLLERKMAISLAGRRRIYRVGVEYESVHELDERGRDRIYRVDRSAA